MHSSLKSDLLQRQLKEGNPTIKPPSLKEDFYPTPFPEKKVAIIWDTGQMVFFYYTHLIGANHSLDNDLNTLTLMFIKHDLILTGYNLHLLFFQFMKDEPHILNVNTERYTEISTDKFILTGAILK